MSITAKKRRDGRTVYDVRLRDGSKRQYSRTFLTRKEATTFESQQRADISRGTWIDPRRSEVSFEALAALWLARNPAKRQSGLAREEAILRNHIYPTLGTRAVGSITPADVQGLVRVWGQRLAPRTVRRQYGVLTAVLNFAVASDIVLRSPARGVKLPAVGVRHRRVLEPAELEALAAELEESCSSGLMVYMGAVLGMRWGECAGLRVEHFDFRDRSLTISNQRTRGWGGRMIEQPPKSEAGRRTLSLPDALMDLLAVHMARRGITAADPDAYLFVGQEGLPLEYSGFRQRRWLPARAAIGRPDLEFHDLRRTNATSMVQAGVDMKTAQSRLGHSDPRLTLGIYAQATTAADRKAATVLAERLMPDPDGRSRPAADVR